MARRARRESERIPSRLVVAIDGQGRSCGCESACPVAAAYAAHRNPRERDAGAASIGVTNEWGENGLGLLPFATSEPLTTEDQHQRRRVSEPLAPEGNDIVCLGLAPELNERLRLACPTSDSVRGHLLETLELLAGVFVLTERKETAREVRGARGRSRDRP
jgi:hypothetical protein